MHNPQIHKSTIHKTNKIVAEPHEKKPDWTVKGGETFVEISLDLMMWGE